MKMAKMLIHIPEPTKAKLDALRSTGYTLSGYVRALIEQDLLARGEAGLQPLPGRKKGR